jgi:toxin ParE1/3/4
MKPLLFSPAAQADLAEIWDYTAERWGTTQADHDTDDLHAACDALAAGRRQGRPVDVRPGYLKYLVGSHVIYFRERGDPLEIVRILHGRMDVSRQF